jgi:TrmH family RNA methyltransferase
MTLSREREKLLERLRRRRTRERERLFLVEGIRAVGEAVAAKADVRFAVVSPRLGELAGGPDLNARLTAAGVERVPVTDDELAALGDTETTQGVLLVCGEPETDLGDLPEGPLLVLDGVQDPGNVGTLVRAAAAFGLLGVVALEGTADPFNPKAVRASAGALFHTRVMRAPWHAVEPVLLARGPVLVADMAGRDVASLPRSGVWTLVVGGEGSGPREAVRAAASGTVAVPMPGGVESLNAGVAGSILLYALTLGGEPSP